MTQTELLLQWQVISYRNFTTFIWFICSDSLASIKMVYFILKYTCCYCFYLSIFDRTVLPCWFSTQSLFTLADHRDWWVPVVQSRGGSIFLICINCSWKMLPLKKTTLKLSAYFASGYVNKYVHDILLSLQAIHLLILLGWKFLCIS